MDVPRILNLPDLLRKKSFFLFGPRSVGKSFLIRKSLPDAKVYNLLQPEVLTELARRPSLLEERQEDWSQIIVLDEIQKLPDLLNEVHRLIEEKGARFLLTGSSARTLRRGGVNSLAGRAWEARLFPFVSAELSSIDLNHALLFGTLPQVHLGADKYEELRAYTSTYLSSEIKEESLVRHFDTLLSFLDTAATKVAEEVNYQSIASDIGVSPPTVRNFFELLEDTLIGFRLKPFQKTVQRKAVSRPKFYLFDLGVTSSLLKRRELAESSDDFGKAFEHFIALELRAYLSYRRSFEPLTYWRSRSGFEVDFLIGDKAAIEVKSTHSVPDRALKGLKALREEGIHQRYIVVSLEETKRVVDGIQILPWREFLEQLWKDRLLERQF